MSIDKMDASAVYAMFEELKQKIAAIHKQQAPQDSSSVGSVEITKLVEELKNYANQRQFTPEQLKELQESMEQLVSSNTNNKVEQEVGEVAKLVNHVIAQLNTLKIPQKFVIRKEHSVAVDFKSSKVAITMLALGLALLVSIGMNVWLSSSNGKLQDSDLKYRYIKMQGSTDGKALLRLETYFTYHRNKDSVSLTHRRVKAYERLVKEQAEKIEQARLNASKAEELQKEVESIKSR